MIYIVVLVAVVIVPAKLWAATARCSRRPMMHSLQGRRHRADLEAVPDAGLCNTGAGFGVRRLHVPHTLTGIFASKSADTIRKNAILLPAYHAAARPDRAARLHGLRANIKVSSPNDVVPLLFKPCSRPGSRASHFRRSHRRAGACGGDEHRCRETLFTRNIWKSISIRHQPCRETAVAKSPRWCEAGRASLHPVPADAICARPAAARRLWILQTLPRWYSGCSHAGSAPKGCCSLGRGHRLGFVDGVEQWPEAARDHRSRRRQLHLLCRARRVAAQHRPSRRS